MKACHKRIKIGFFVAFVHCLFLQAAAQELKRPPLTGIAFVELQVADIKKAMHFYKDLLGYQLVAGPDKKIHSFIVPVSPRQTIKIQDGLQEGQDERLLSLAFQTTDARAMLTYLQLKNVQVTDTIHSEKKGWRWFAVTDPDNHTIKFVEYTAGRYQQPETMPANSISARILHAGLTISAATAADAFYKDILGFDEIWRGGSNDTITSWINMRLPESTDYLEYMLVTGTVNRQQLGGLHHIALMVPDLQQALDVLNNRAAAKDFIIAAPRIGRNRRWQLNLYDPDGTRIELMEPFPMR